MVHIIIMIHVQSFDIQFCFIALNIGAPIDANYEPPTNADVHLKPSGRNTASMCKEIVDTLVANVSK